MGTSLKRWAFVDYENQPQSLHFIGQRNDYNCVLVFFGAQQKVTMELNKSLILRLIRIENTGKNNLDFHLTYYLGKYDVKLDKRIAFDIFTKDTGFDHLIQFMRQQGRNCQRIEVNSEKTTTIQRITQIETAKVTLPKMLIESVVKPVITPQLQQPVVNPHADIVVENPHFLPAVQRVLDHLKKVTHRPKTADKLMNTINSLIRYFNDDTLSAQQVFDELLKQKKIALNMTNKSIHWHV